MGKLRFSVLFFCCLCVTINLTILSTLAATKTEGNAPMGNYGELIEGSPVSQIGFRATGGRSPVEEYGITVKEYSDRIVIRSFEKWARGEKGFDKEATLSKEEYKELWTRIEKYNVWTIKKSQTPLFFDAFWYDFVFLKDGKLNEVNETQGLEGGLRNVALILDELGKKKLGVSLYSQAGQSPMKGQVE